MQSKPSLVILLFILAPCFASSQTLLDVKRGDTTAALELVKAGADVNQLESDRTPLMLACRWGDEPMVRLLLAHGATPDHPRTSKGRTALMVACAYYSGRNICELLVAKGADVNAASIGGTTALMLAAKNGKIEVVNFLLSKSADKEKKDTTGQTALDYARQADAETLNSMKNDPGLKEIRFDVDAVIAKLKAK